MELKYDYQPPKDANGQHVWSVVGPEGGVHIWARESTMKFSNERFIGGVEVHAKKPMYGDQPVSHEHCWLLGGPCYHDGTSLYFSERIEPYLRGDPFSDATHEFVNAELLDWYQDKFAAREAGQ